MARDWESDFKTWSKPPTATEDERCSNAESVVRNAIRSYVGFATRSIEVFAHGSYRGPPSETLVVLALEVRPQRSRLGASPVFSAQIGLSGAETGERAPAVGER